MVVAVVIRAASLIDSDRGLAQYAADVELGRLKSLVAHDQQLERVQMMRYSGYAECDEQPFSADEANKITSATLDGLQMPVTLMAVYEL